MFKFIVSIFWYIFCGFIGAYISYLTFDIFFKDNKLKASINCHAKYSASGLWDGKYFYESGTNDRIEMLPSGCWVRVRQ